MPKAKGQILKFFKKIGAKGGKARAAKYTAAERTAMAKKGGRPPTDWSKVPARSWDEPQLMLALIKRLNGRSLRVLANEIGCSYQHLYNLFHGKATTTPVDSIYKYLRMKNPHAKPEGQNRDARNKNGQ